MFIFNMIMKNNDYLFKWWDSMDNNLTWEEFNFKDIFTIQSGYYNKKPPFKTYGTLPFIGATALNNGITGFCNIEDIKLYSKKGEPTENTLDDKIFEGNCITVTNNGSIGYAFYQKAKFLIQWLYSLPKTVILKLLVLAFISWYPSS